ncbi:hypothetical protein DM872_01675 [Pseudomonas taiwanensis]|nr:hypothetical protein [Pseudomonas taiwanensis]
MGAVDMSISRTFVALLAVLLYSGATYGLGCNHTFDLEMRTRMCALELENEWRAKLKPDDSCARLMAEARKFVSNFERGEIQVNEGCTAEALIKAADDATATIAKAREKGWTTLEDYLNY